MRFRRRARDELAINIVPLIDVVLFLVIFFVVSSSFVKQGKLSITLPQADQQTQQQEARSIDLMIDSEGNYQLNGEVLMNNQRRNLLEALRQLNTQYQLEKQQPALIISADAKAPHQSVVRAMDAAAELGLSNIRIAVRHD